MDMVSSWAQSYPLAYVLTSDEAIGAYAYNWAQVLPVDSFFSPPLPGTPLAPIENPPLWQVWWIGTTDYARMDAQALTAFVSHRAPDPSPRLNQLLDVSPLAQQTDFAPGGTWAGFWEGNADDEDATVYSILFFWVFAALMAALPVAILGQVAGQLAARQQPLLAALRERNRGISRGRLVGGGALALLVLAPTGLALLAGGLLAMLVARLVTAAMLPASVRPVIDTLVSGPLDTGYRFGLAGGIAALLLVLAAVLAMLHAMRHATRLATSPELASDY